MFRVARIASNINRLMTGGGSRTAFRVFKALSAETRVEMLRLLSRRSLCVGAIANMLSISAGAVSQHLRVLKDAGLVEPDRRGCFVHYRVAPRVSLRCRAAMEALLQPRQGGKSCAAEKISAKSRGK